MELPPQQFISTLTRRSNGCWTCRLRRKKCDEKRDVCEACATLDIICFYDENKPIWMDNGSKQAEMAERVKRQIKEKASRRRVERPVQPTNQNVSDMGPSAEREAPWLKPRPQIVTDSRCHLLKSTLGIHSNGMQPCPSQQENHERLGASASLSAETAHKLVSIEQSDMLLVTFYLEHLLPFLFPFYCPSLSEGGRAWILEMMLSSPVVRQATLCQSSYFFSLVMGNASQNAVWEGVLVQTRNAFEVLRRSLDVIAGSDISEHLHGAARIMASIMQVQRFEIAVLSFRNCQSHLNAATALFKQMLGSYGTETETVPRSRYNYVLECLKSSLPFPRNFMQFQSAEQAAFRFSSALLVLDDIIASMINQEEPRLYEYHESLLGRADKKAQPAIDLEAAVGCQNWALLLIGRITALDAWKQRYKSAGNLDVMQLVYTATAIKDLLKTHLTRLETSPVVLPNHNENNLLDVFAGRGDQQPRSSVCLTPLVTQVWAHAALLYLSVVVSGWQPASDEVRYHTKQIIDLLNNQISPPALLRTMVWPFCVAGCLAEPSLDGYFRAAAQKLQPPSVFGTAHKALEIMERVWSNRSFVDGGSFELAACFRDQSDLILLV